MLYRAYDEGTYLSPRKSFFEGYNNLGWFFGVKHDDPKTPPLIDRINLYSKVILLCHSHMKQYKSVPLKWNIWRCYQVMKIYRGVCKHKKRLTRSLHLNLMIGISSRYRKKTLQLLMRERWRSTYLFTDDDPTNVLKNEVDPDLRPFIHIWCSQDCTGGEQFL